MTHRRRTAAEVFAADGFDSVHLAPDGRMLSWTSRADRHRIVVAPLGDDDGAARAAVTSDTAISFHTWAPDGRHLLHVHDPDGSDVWQLQITSIADGRTRRLTPADRHADLLALSPSRPHELLVTVDDPVHGLPHVELVDVRSGRSERLVTNPGTVDGWFADPDLVVRAATAPTPDGGFDLWHRASASAPWRPVGHVPAEHALGTLVTSLPSAHELVLVTALDGDTTSLVSLDARSGDRRTMASRAGVDLDRVLLDRRTGQPQAVSWYADRRTWQALDPAVAADLCRLADLGLDVRIVDRSDDDRRWLVALDDAVHPTSFAVWDRHDGNLVDADAVSPDRRATATHAVHAVEIHARDGLRLDGYWSPPVTGTGPHPTVLLVHGGPWWRDSWEHDPWREWINELGLACLQVNFRGSSGRGSAFAAAGVRAWGDAVIDDLEDALDHAVRHGWSDPQRLTAFGSSFGGYAALVLAARGRLAAVAAHAAPTDLVEFLEAFPPSHPTMDLLWRSRFGDVDDPDDRARLARTSPIALADRIDCPVLLAHGRHDARIPADHARRMHAALVDHGRRSTLLVLDGEGHELRQTATTVRLADALALLLADR
ncbi:MAG: prolyl oligopeptidase family serine peptidase [Desertimonas sp.]